MPGFTLEGAYAGLPAKPHHWARLCQTRIFGAIRHGLSFDRAVPNSKAGQSSTKICDVLHVLLVPEPSGTAVLLPMEVSLK